MKKCHRTIIVLVLIVICLFLFGAMVVSEKYMAYTDILQNPYHRVVQFCISNQAERGNKPIYMITGVNPPMTPLDPKYSYLLIDMEPFDLHSDYGTFDFVLTTKRDRVLDSVRQIYVPNWSLAIGEAEQWSVPSLLQTREPRRKLQFCACIRSQMSDDALARKKERIFYEKIHSRKHSIMLDNCSNKVDILVDTLRPYKFVVIFDPLVRGYVSEKILSALLAGAVPVYSGDSSIRDMFNPGCYINIDDFSSIESCINYIMYVDSRPDLYETYTRTPILSNQRLLEYAGWYYGTQTFYQALYRVFPHLKRDRYVPIPYDRSTHPTKPIKIINLDYSTDRWKTMQAQLDANPYWKDKYERFSAVQGKQYYSSYRSYTSTKHYTLNPGEVGLYLSTMELCKRLVEDEQNEYYAHLEDDTLVTPDVLSVDAYITKIPKNWDILFLGYSQHYCKQDKHIETADQPFVKMQLDCLPCTHAYVIRKRAAQFLLNHAFPMEYPIDVFYQLHCQNLNIYLIHPRVIHVADGIPSTIQIA